MQVIYVAGKYRGKSEWEVAQNIRKAEDAAMQLWQSGWIVVCPHKNSQGMGGAVTDKQFLDGGLEILSRCDAIYMLKEWQWSIGAVTEVSQAVNMNIPVYFQKDGIPIPNKEIV